MLFSGEVVVLVRVPSRLLVAGSVLAALAASSSTALTMPDRVADTAADVPDVAAGAGRDASAPIDTPITTGPAVTGAQIAQLALAPARDRAAALIAEQRAEAEAAAAAAEAAARAEAELEAARERASRPTVSPDHRRMRAELREACERGWIQGVICRGA
jgi:hypothetical protein